MKIEYIALDGRRFENQDECKAYEDSFECFVSLICTASAFEREAKSKILEHYTIQCKHDSRIIFI